MKLPISLIIDDPTPVISLSHYGENRFLSDGREKIERYTYEALLDFCAVVEKYGIKGKFSIVPMPAGRGDIVHGIKGVDPCELKLWLDTVREYIAPRFSICPEMITHGKAVNLKDGALTDIREDVWASQQSKETLREYIGCAIELVRDAGFDVRGVTSPWEFGLEVESDYVQAISDAVYDKVGKTDAWYFLHCIRDTDGVRPWLALDDGERTVVSIPATTHDHMWKTLESPRTDSEFINEVADGLISEDGRHGEIIKVIESGGYPIFLTHWQCLMSNGSSVGIRVLETVARRINEHLSDKVEWMSIEEIADMVLANKELFNK